MLEMLRRLVLLVPLVASTARADGQCHVVDVEITPSDALQIVAWVETPPPNPKFVETIYITRKTGSFGLGNRPGRFDFNSGPPPGGGKDDMWPYGRRITTFPVWAHRHGLSWPAVVFQNGDDNNLSHPFNQSSREVTPPYCRPTMPGEGQWDTATCASSVFTDKGTLSTTQTSLYPPRSDLTRQVGTDSVAVDMYKTMNPFDAVSQATPTGGTDTHISWPIPQSLPSGDYVLWLEVSKEFDFNNDYNATTQPPPCGGAASPCTPPSIPWYEYGEPYRGQPSAVYSVPFTIGTSESMVASQAYVGYGDPDGASGTLHVPDSTITTGAQRLLMIAGSSDVVRVDARPEMDNIAPSQPGSFAPMSITASAAQFRFIAPGNDGQIGKVTGYEIRFLANQEMTTTNFDAGIKLATTVVPDLAGTLQTFELDGLLPETDYWVGVRAFDACHNVGPIAITKFTTADRQTGEVNACFVATAAYGSAMAKDVQMLRRFRDAMLRNSALGELAVEAYYTFGPGVAGMVGESDLLRALARDALSPLVSWVRGLSF